ncbi:MAG: hypothetical protein KGI29_08345 [Pseudomonadota bacterium]|nr:hypothetical protein [Pseudomonadota bacterium]MDE3037114.1 hypothetical protein [Pseudomonadota bacterium]
MPPDVPENMMERLPHYRSKYNAAKKIHVYYVPARNRETGTKTYFYAIVSELLHDEMMRCLKSGDIPHFAAIVERGEGEPTREVKAKIKAFYGFDHAAAGES